MFLYLRFLISKLYSLFKKQTYTSVNKIIKILHNTTIQKQLLSLFGVISSPFLCTVLIAEMEQYIFVHSFLI